MTIYLDYMATTPVDPRVIDKMIAYLGPDGIFGNPASVTHEYGLKALQAIDTAREQLAAGFGALPSELIFTSGATEANNMAILGASRFYCRKGKHVITMNTEHRAVLDSFRALEREGFEVTYLPPKSDGLLDLEVLKQALRKDTIFVSIMHVNNEIGVVQDIAAIGELLANKGIIFHVDAAQSAGKLPIDLKQLKVHLMSFSAHKNYGPKGAGMLYVSQKPRIRLEPLSFGGGQERGYRAGSLATHQIMGMAEAFAVSLQLMQEEQKRLLSMRNRVWEGIRHLPGIQLNGHPTQRLAGNLSLSFAGIDPDSLLLALKELAISRTSACASSREGPSYVLKALGLSDLLAFSSIRLTMGRFTTDRDVDRVIEIICQQIRYLQEGPTRS